MNLNPRILGHRPKKRRHRDAFGNIGSGEGNSCFLPSSLRHNNQNRPNSNFQRLYPIGVNKLKELLAREPCIISEELLRLNSGYDQLLNTARIFKEKLCLVIRLLNITCGSRANMEGTVDLLIRSFKSDAFRQNLLSFISEIKFNRDDIKYLLLIGNILSEFTRLTPVNAFPPVSELSTICVGTLQCLKLEGLDGSEITEVEQVFNNLQSQIKESREKYKKSEQPFKRGLTLDAAPDNFRDHEILPTPQEIDKSYKPFIRPVIAKGSYENSQQYLDVHFRLLKEDFVRPLRIGINSYLEQRKRKNLDIRVYSDVQIHSTAIQNNEPVLYLKLNLNPRFKIENSRRFMFGNILCISADNFKTMLFASVSNRDHLMEKRLGIKPESNPFPLDPQNKYTVVESKAYFVSYKYTLQALQKFDKVPLENYIVDVKETNAPPTYASELTTYKLSRKQMLETFDLINPEGKTTTRLLDEIHLWPSAHELKLDDSQRRAFYGALTRKLAIIQGPPGTGKTFIGLKITQVLLRNKSCWSNDGRSPILVVCFTNHALDQFLEGIMKFTNRIVRIGSRSKSEILSRFQINRMLSQATNNQIIDCRYNELRLEMSQLEHRIGCIDRALEKVNIPGVISLESFEYTNIIPPTIFSQIENIESIPSMKYWLFDDLYKSESDETIRSMEVKEDDVSTATSEELCSRQAEDDPSCADVDDEIRQEAEYNRILDDEEEPPYESLSQEYKQVFSWVIWHDRTLAEISNAAACELNVSLNKSNSFETIIKAKHEFNYLEAEYRALKSGLTIDDKSTEGKELQKAPDVWNLNLIQRWKLYNHWKRQLIDFNQRQKSTLELEYHRLFRRMQNLKSLKYLAIMKETDIVGMTTTAAAQYSNILHDLAPPIVIVEEAAEILESHVVTSLSPACQHLILIGDHKQLRPKANVYELGLKFNLEVSLFERMIKNGMSYEILEFQHRMKPLFSNLLVPEIYKELKDHPSVLNYPKIKGIEKDFYFVDHNEMESSVSDDDESFHNMHEAEFLMGLCRHLMLQGYCSNDITLLTPYSGQFRTFKQLLKKDEFHPCAGVRASILDNYQGEECNIILLSLVRSNPEEKVGFLKIDNRICVALSRAKHGMYIIGNMTQMVNSCSLWAAINDKLVLNGHIGRSLNLICQNHSEEILPVKSGSDFLAKSPEGGCRRQCLSSLPDCEHLCPTVCHVVNSDHKQTRCTEKCNKLLCSLGHLCPKLCFENCPQCKVLVEKQLPCGHTHPVSCSIEAEDFMCTTMVTRVPNCNHSVEVECYVGILKLKCKTKCIVRLDCGHQCKRTCHIKHDPDHENYNCKEPCERKPRNCERDHKCPKKCYEECGICLQSVIRKLKCGHILTKVACGRPEDEIFCPSTCKKYLPCKHLCRKKCGDTCGNCRVKVKKIVPECLHTIEIECKITPTTALCSNRCTKNLTCGHACQRKCKDPCDESKCSQAVASNFTCPKGHNVKIPCNLRSGGMITNDAIDLKANFIGEYCTEMCGETLECGHICQGKCGKCFNGRLHVSCKKPCTRVLVCGHVCKEPCSADCPPCQQKCLWKCSHSQCMKTCGLPCVPCREPCTRRCLHSRCLAKCGDKCKRDPCTQPCPHNLKCGHKCIGFCGEPCPPKCRICHRQEVTTILFGTEEDEDARFIMLEDCGHFFEAEALCKYMEFAPAADGGPIAIEMKKCPSCTKVIYNTKRFQRQILEVYSLVKEVKRKYFSSKETLDNFEMRKSLKELTYDWVPHVQTIQRNLGLNKDFQRLRRQIFISDAQVVLYSFQLKFLMSAKLTRKNLGDKEQKLHSLVELVMKRKLSISFQMMDELICELRRLEVCALIERVITNEAKGPPYPVLDRILNDINKLMDGKLKFGPALENDVNKLLKEAELHVGRFEVTKEERLRIVQAIGLSPGHWYCCPKGHPYVIGDCGGAMEESNCPECKSRIGGSRHRLRSDNRVATEMAGATAPAWPQGHL